MRQSHNRAAHPDRECGSWYRAWYGPWGDRRRGAGACRDREIQRGRKSAAEKIWSGEYWANKGDVKLFLYRKRLTAPRKGAEPMPVLFLVHGSSLSSASSYDLTVPGKGEYSMMDVFARDGFDVWTMDHDGYGRSTVTSNNSDIASGVADLTAGLAVLARETGRSKYHVFGKSSGAIRAGAFAQAKPDRIDRLMLAAFTYKGDGAAEIKRRRRARRIARRARGASATPR